MRVQTGRPIAPVQSFLKAGGEMGAIIRAIDWSRTPLGPMETWSQSLKTALSIILHSKFPMFLFWGDELTCFYNDAFRPSLGAEGGKHPWATGKPGKEVWAEIWDTLNVMIRQVLDKGEAVWHEDLLVPFYRNGQMEDIYWTFSYSPVYDELGKPAGVFVTCTETTDKLLTMKRLTESERRFRGILEQAPDPILILKGENMVLEVANEPLFKVWNVGREAIGKPFLEILPEMKGQGYLEMLQDVYFNDKIVKGNEAPAFFARPDGSTEKKYFNFIYQPYRDADGTISGVLVMANDVTLQVLARQRMQESEERFRALVTATSDVVYRMSPDWKIMRALEGRGILSDTGEPIVDWLDKYIHPNDQGRVKEMINEAVKSKTIFEMEHQVLHADGSLGWTFSRAIPILDENGNIIEWFGAATDITQRRNIAEALRITRDELEGRKRLYEAITGSTPDLIYVFDLNYKFVYANKALLTMWGRTWEESIGQGLLALGYEPWHAEMHEREIDEVVATKRPIRGEVSFPHATLGKRIYDYIFAPVLNEKGEVEVIAGTTRDISDLKLAEEALKQSEEQFRTLTQSLPQLIWTSRPDGYYDFFNQQWYDYTGSTPETSEGDGWAQYIHEAHRQQLYNKWQESLDTGKPIVFEFELRAKDGSYQWFYVAGNPIRDDEGQIRKWVGALTNIEEQKTVAEKLEQLVNERTKELKRSNEDLLQFAHVASHDLKEPVRKVRTFVSRLQSDPETTLSKSGENFLNKIKSATDRMYSMIDGVLTYSTMSNEEQAFTKVDLNEVIKGIENDLEILINQKHACITHEKLPVIEGAPVLIYQLFYNLLNNSLKFAKEGTPSVISISSQPVMVNGREFTQIDIRDNGIGFPQVYAEKIFYTFTRLNTKDQYEGTGLGLALCKKIVERHGGTITATGEEHQGAVLTITLPVYS